MSKFKTHDLVYYSNSKYSIIGIVEEDLWIQNNDNERILFASKGEYKIRRAGGTNSTYTYAPESMLKLVNSL